MNTLERPINTYSIGSFIDVPGTPYYAVEITGINDSGVSIKSPHYPQGATFSGQSPAIPHVRKEAIVNPETGNKSVVLPVITRTKRTEGQKTRHFDIPSDRFTIKELAAENKVEYYEVLDFIKLYCVEAGEAERLPGQRGKTAKLYKYNE